MVGVLDKAIKWVLNFQNSHYSTVALKHYNFSMYQVGTVASLLTVVVVGVVVVVDEVGGLVKGVGQRTSSLNDSLTKRAGYLLDKY